MADTNDPTLRVIRSEFAIFGVSGRPTDEEAFRASQARVREAEREQRESERFEQAMSSYIEGSAPGTWNCPCGTVVWDREKRIRQHDADNATSQKADAAYQMDQPIGSF